MKDNYSPYPSNNERVGTMQYEDAIDYENEFYTNKEFHVKRIEKGKKMVGKEVGKAALCGVLLAAGATGCAVFGADFVTQQIPGLFGTGAVDAQRLIADSFALVAAGAITPVSFTELKEGIKRIGRMNKDIEASEKMVAKLSNDSTDSKMR